MQHEYGKTLYIHFNDMNYTHSTQRHMSQINYYKSHVCKMKSAVIKLLFFIRLRPIHINYNDYKNILSLKLF